MLRSQTDYQGNRTRYDFDVFGRLTRWTGPAGDTTTMEYDTEGNPLHIVLADGGNIYCTYDTIGNLVSLIDGAGRTTRYRYGHVSSVAGDDRSLGKIMCFEWGTEPDRLERIVISVARCIR